MRRGRNTRRPARPSHKQVLDLEDLLRKDFHRAAGRQKRCAACGHTGPFQAHHVLYKQHLRAEGLPLWDPRNALRVCQENSPARCHQRHHNATGRINLTALTDANITFAFEALGAAAYDYLHRYYDGRDPRVDAKLEEVTADAA